MIALLALAVLAKEPEPVTPYYETRDLGLRWRGEGHSLRPYLVEEMRKLGLEAWEELPDGRLRKRPVFGWGLTLDSMGAGVVVLANEAVGAEFDGMIGVGRGEELRPVTVRWETGRLVFIEGERTGVLLVADPDSDTLVARFGIAGIEAEEGRSWDALSTGLLAEALQSLSPEELALLDHVHFRRASIGRETQQGRWIASHGLHDGVSRVEIYDDAFVPSTRFVGDPDQPRPWVLAVLLHEIGHAIAWSAEYERQQALQALDVLAIEARNHGDGVTMKALTVHADRLVALYTDRSPAADALLHTLANRPPPTWYGRTGPEESFADCFALYHADRAALERAAPEAVAFFDEGGHLAALARARAAIDAAEITPPASP